MDWTEKYRPSTLREVRGNDASVQELREWAESWDEHGEAALVIGEPGVGKTSAVHALASDLGWEVTELNASDSRTKDAVESVAGEAARSQTLTGGKHLVVLDEADNLHGNADRGGAGAVTDIVKEAQQPVVLIANDEYEISGALKRATRSVEFGNVSSRSILPVLRDILEEEGITFEKQALQVIADRNSGDLRGAINDLQAAAAGRDELTAADVTATGPRDSAQDIFPFLDVVFQDTSLNKAIRQARDVDESPDDLIHWIDDNMPKSYEGDELDRGFASLARADVYLGRTRRTQNYGYWRYANDLMVGGVQAAKDGEKGGWTRYSPPSTFRKLGRTRKKRRLRDQVARKVAEASLTSMAAVRDELFPALRAMLEERSAAIELADELDLTADELAYMTGMSDSEAADVVAAAGSGEAAVQEEDWDREDDEDDAEMEADGAASGDAADGEDDDGAEQAGLGDF